MSPAAAWGREGRDGREGWDRGVLGCRSGGVARREAGRNWKEKEGGKEIGGGS